MVLDGVDDEGYGRPVGFCTALRVRVCVCACMHPMLYALNFDKYVFVENV